MGLPALSQSRMMAQGHWRLSGAVGEGEARVLPGAPAFPAAPGPGEGLPRVVTGPRAWGQSALRSPLMWTEEG